MLKRSRTSEESQGVIFAISPTIGTSGRVPKGAWPRPMESSFVQIEMLTPKEGFASEEEVQAFLEKYMQPMKKPKFPKPKELWHQAQEIAYKGWEKRTASGRRKAAQKAFAISPDAPDAYLLLAQDATSWEEALELEHKALSASEQIMGENYRTTYPEFWGPAITRPYMRARFAIGYTLWRMGRQSEARAEFQDLLRLNSNDNQGARYVLVAIYLEAQENGQVQKIISLYSPEALSHWAYMKTLMHFRRRGDDRACRDLLHQAKRANPEIPAFLVKGLGPKSPELDYIEAGAESEAIEHVQLYRPAWQLTAGALEWLEKTAPKV